jgi:hypothetical protein
MGAGAAHALGMAGTVADEEIIRPAACPVRPAASTGRKA